MSWTAADLPSFAGRTVIVTGANSGLGLVTARELARVGAHVVLACRNTAKGDEAAATVTGDIEVRRLDLQDLASIREFAGGVYSIDVLINNAGTVHQRAAEAPRCRRLVADVAGRPPRLLGDQPAGPHRQPDRDPVLGRRKQPVRHQRRLRRPPDAVRGVGGPAGQYVHRAEVRDARADRSLAAQPAGPRRQHREGTVAAIRAAPGDRISALSWSSATLGVASRRGWSGHRYRRGFA